MVVVNLFFLLHFTTVELKELEALEKLAVENVSHIIIIVLFFCMLQCFRFETRSLFRLDKLCTCECSIFHKTQEKNVKISTCEFSNSGSFGRVVELGNYLLAYSLLNST